MALYKSSITQEEEDRINAAMTRHNGKVPEAAQDLEMTTKQLHDKLRLHRFRDKWGVRTPNIEPPLDSIALTREVRVDLGVPPTPVLDEKEVALALQKEDEKIRRGISRLGFTGKALDQAMDLQRFHRGHFRTVVDLLGGGLTQQYLALLSDIEDCRALIKANDMDPEEMEAFLKYHIQLMEQLTQMYDRAVNASLVSAKISALRNGGAGVGGGKRPSRPAFSALKSANQEEAADEPPA